MEYKNGKVILTAEEALKFRILLGEAMFPGGMVMEAWQWFDEYDRVLAEAKMVLGENTVH